MTKRIIRAHNFIDITGRRFGWLTVVSLAGKNKWGKPTWHCVCICGAKTVVTGNNLLSGSSTRCKSGACPVELADTFYSNIKKAGKCWIWMAKKNKQGYGDVGRSGRSVRAHRCSYEMHVGPIPDGLWVLHRCDNPSCVNPVHLFLGTAQSNIADRDAKRRQAWGEKNSGHKLTARDVKWVIIRAADGADLEQLAKEYGVTYGCIRNIITGRSW